MESKMDVEPEPKVKENSTLPQVGDRKLTMQDISRSISYITRGVELSQPRLIQRAIRQNPAVRKHITRELLTETVSSFVPLMCPTFDYMMQAISFLPFSEPSNAEQMTLLLPNFVPPVAVLPEVEVFIFNTIVTTLLREKLDTNAANASSALIERIQTFNRRSLDLISSKAFLYFSLSFEKISRLENIRPVLLALYRTACVRHDEMSQSVLLNLILRNYLHYNLIEQAQTLSLRTTFPEGASNNQFCRYLYYMGRIQAIQLEYSSAYQRLVMAVRKAPPDVGLGFTVMAQKLSIIVQLLMGDIPEKSIFNVPEHRVALLPYLALTQAVRNGDLQLFDATVAKHAACFKTDKNHTLVMRLGHNVLKTGLRKISLSYSRITLTDVAAKLHLPSAASAEYICAKSIRDGVIEATIDHDNGWLLSNETIDVYSSDEPQKVFHKRIEFCLGVYNEAVKSMRYPPDAYKKELKQDADKSGDKNEKTIEELLKDFEEEFD